MYVGVGKLSSEQWINILLEQSLLLPCAGDQGSSRLASDSPLPVNPGVVVGTKAVEAAYQEGKWPVVDKAIDVYALQCSAGMTSTLCWAVR